MNASKIRTTVYAVGGSAVLAGSLIGTAAAASAAPVNHQATGAVTLAGPLQNETFTALQNGRWHGQVDYTNWTYVVPGSGVFAPQPGAHPLTVKFGSSTFAHTLNGSLKLTGLSPERLAFSGTGSYPGITWKISGQVNGNRLTATIAYDGQTYKAYLNGVIARDGSVSGTALDSARQRLTFSLPAGSFASVLHYTAPVQSAKVQRQDAQFSFTVPARAGLGSNVKVTVTVHDGGWGAAHDRYAHNGASYPITGGTGVTIR